MGKGIRRGVERSINIKYKILGERRTKIKRSGETRSNIKRGRTIRNKERDENRFLKLKHDSLQLPSTDYSILIWLSSKMCKANKQVVRCNRQNFSITF